MRDFKVRPALAKNEVWNNISLVYQIIAMTSHHFANLRHVHFRPPGSARYFCVWCSWSKSPPKKGLEPTNSPGISSVVGTAFLIHETWHRSWGFGIPTKLVGYSADKWQTYLAFFFLRWNPAGCTCQRVLWVLLFVFHFGWSSHVVPSTRFFKGKKLAHINRHPAAIHKGSCIIHKKAVCCFLCLVFRFFCNPQQNTDITNMQSGILLTLQRNHLSRLFIKSLPGEPNRHLLPRFLIFGKRTRHRRSACPMSRSKTANLRAKVSSTIEGYQKTLKIQNCLKIRDP